MSKLKFFARAGFLALMLALSQYAHASPDLTEYELVFGDEFDGPALDEEKWTSRFFWGPYVPINGEEQYYVDSLDLDGEFQYSPFSFSDGVLSITAVPTTASLSAPAQPEVDDALWTTSPDLNFNPEYDESTRNYLSGIITSAQSYSVTHGYFEARLKFPEGQGLWPAFWLLNSQYVERFPEIDIVEFLGHKKDTVHHTMHWIDTFSYDQHTTVSTPTYETIKTDFTADFHTFGLAWDPKKVRFYVDGEMVREITDSEFFISTQSMYLLLNLAVGGTWAGAPDETTPFPASYDIDYVRAYERKSIDVITATTLADDYQLMFSDEFDGDALDADKWNTALLWGPYQQINNEEQVYIDTLGMHNDHSVDPFEVSSGSLKIRAQPIAPSDLPEIPDTTDPIWNEYPNYQQSNQDFGLEGGWVPSYSSGALISYDSFKFVNGYAEARIKLPVGSGLWPAFWLLHGYYNGPTPEMDILEAKGESSASTHHSYHYYDYSVSTSGLISSATEYVLPGTGIDDFHVYGFQWDRERMVWYVDGVVVKEITGPEVSQQLSYVLLNMAVGGNFVADVDSNALPAEMEVDWVRVWQVGNSYNLQDDSDAPELSFITPIDDQVVTAGAVLGGLVWDEVGGSGVEYVRVAVRDLDAGVWVDLGGQSTGAWTEQRAELLVSDGGDELEWQVTTLEVLPTGRYQLYAVGVDESGNQRDFSTTDSVRFSVGLDDSDQM